MSAVYDLLLRHIDLLTPKTTVLGSAKDFSGEWLSVVKKNELQINTWDWLTAQAYQGHIDNKLITFGLPTTDQLQDRTVILLWPKAKPFAQALIQLIATTAKRCYVVAANDAGGKSIGSACKEFSSSTTKLDSARHCSLWSIDLTPVTKFNWLAMGRSFKWDAADYLTLPGVFSHGSLDSGTSVLLEHLPAPAHGRLLDLGCGSGVIGLSLKKRSPSLEVVLTDVDAFALRSAQLNSMRLALPVEILHSDGLTAIDGRFDFIITNPPFHQGKNTDYQFAQNLFKQAKQHLVKDGQLWLIANRHLGYEEWAQEAFDHVEVMVQEKGFKLICAQEPL